MKPQKINNESILFKIIFYLQYECMPFALENQEGNGFAM